MIDSFAGTFARVCLCRERASRDYFALKILAIHDVIRYEHCWKLMKFGPMCL
jgi:hypothetical protein